MSSLFFGCFCFRDVKCILELDFAFKIHTMSLREEFLVCASETECQSIQLNFGPNVCDESSGGEKELSGSAQFVELSTGSDIDVAGRLASPADCQCHFCQGASIDASSSPNVNDTTTNPEPDISHIVQSTVNDDDLDSSGNANGYGKSLAFFDQARLRQVFAHTDLGLSQTADECDELFAGPVKGSQAPCAVSVEFEGIVFNFWNCTSYFLL